MKIFPLLVLLVLLSFSFACSKKEKVETKHVPSSLKQMLPYTDGQTIRYTSDLGSTITATIAVRSDVVEKSNCPGCEPYVREEYIEYELITDNRKFVRFAIDTRPVIFMSIFSPLANFQFGYGFDFATIEGVAQPVCNGPRQTCLNSVVLNGKTYTNVLEVSSGATASNQLTKAYYTVGKGLIGFAYGNGTIYALKE